MPGSARVAVQLLLRMAFKLLIVLHLPMFLSLQGCAHKPQHPLLNFSGRTALMMSAPSNEGLAIPGRGALSASGRGASAGAVLGAGIGAHTQYAAIFFIPLLGSAGAVGGALYGVAASESRETWQAAEILFAKAIADAEIAGALAAKTASYAEKHGYELSLRRHPLPESRQPASFSSLAQEGFDTLLKIEDLSASLVPADDFTAVRPNRQLIIQARVRLVSIAEETVLADHLIRSGRGSSRSLEAWTAENAKIFREELRQATSSLSENIVAEMFMLYRFPKQLISVLPFFMDVEVTGLSPIHPPLPYGLTMIPDCPSLQPEFSWRSFDGENVTYDLQVWNATGGMTVFKPGSVAYQKEGIVGNSHKLESPLMPSQMYFWSVRAHFSTAGRGRVTEWSQYKLHPAALMSISTLGLAYALGPGRTFYQFRTTRLPKPQPQ